MLHLLLDIVVAVLAIFGFWCAVRTFIEALLSPQQIVIAVEIRTEEDAAELNALLEEARGAFFRKGHTRLAVLLSGTLMQGIVGEGEELYPVYEEMLERYGADLYLID